MLAFLQLFQITRVCNNDIFLRAISQFKKFLDISLSEKPCLTGLNKWFFSYRKCDAWNTIEIFAVKGFDAFIVLRAIGDIDNVNALINKSPIYSL